MFCYDILIAFNTVLRINELANSHFHIINHILMKKLVRGNQVAL